MSLKLETDVGVLTAYLGGEIDHHTARELRESIDEAANEQKPGKLLLNFREVTFMDSSGIGIIIGRYKKISCFGGKVYAIHVDERIRKILRTSGMASIIEVLS